MIFVGVENLHLVQFIQKIFHVHHYLQLKNSKRCLDLVVISTYYWL